MTLGLSISDLKEISEGKFIRFSITVKDQDGPLWTCQGWRVTRDGRVIAPSAPTTQGKGFAKFNHTTQRFDEMVLRTLRTFPQVEGFLVLQPDVEIEDIPGDREIQ